MDLRLSSEVVIYLVEHEVEIVALPRTHRDGARSFCCVDSAGVQVQVIYYPPLNGVDTD